MRICKIEDCKNVHVARGWCKKHHERWRKYGDPLTCKNVVYCSPEEAFEARTIPEPMSGCLLWIGGANSNGYGMLSDGTKLVLAHRYAWECVNGIIPPGIQVLHKCDNPACCNIDHLFIGTQQDNMADMASKNRGAKQKGEECGRSKLTENNVRNIIASSDTNATLAHQFGVSYATISSIRCRRSWKHIALESE